jgi:prepilin-type N-terminal cleavage/methylation domain-containing protein/prepilin-type processing-associated H-X9-DG protein
MRRSNVRITRTRGYTLIELLVVISIIAVLVGLLLPAVQAAREAARRIQCCNNLKQVALALRNYEDVNGTLPPCAFWQAYAGDYSDGAGHLVRVAPFLEQYGLYNAMNWSLPMYCDQNTTISGNAVVTFWCPSDGEIVNYRHTYPAGFGGPSCLKGPLPMTYSSYAGCLGKWPILGYVDSTFSTDQTALSQVDGVLLPGGYPPGNPVTIYGTSYPGRPGNSPATLASITDGLSNTIAYSEHAHGLFSKTQDSQGNTDFDDWNWWVSGNFGDTIFTTFFPLNPQNKLKTDYYEGGAFIQGDSLVLSASSFHPGGANFAFMDGSVKFIKETIDSWKIDPATSLPPGCTYQAPFYRLSPGTRVPVYQALSTRNGGEVISAGSF